MQLRLALLVAASLLALSPVVGCKSRATPAPMRGPQLGLPMPPEPDLARARQPVMASVIPVVAGTGERYTLDSGDKLRVVVFGQENLSRTYAVDGGGYISMPLIGAVQARGVTTYELERRIAAQLSEKFIKEPKVTVEIEAYRPFFILGEVQKPGQYPYVNGMTVQTAVAIAGGYTERARERNAELTRKHGPQSVTRTVANGAPVMPGDTIYIKERFF